MVNPPVPLRLRILRGNPGKRPLRPEPQPAVTECCPEPPSFLSKYAVDEWWRVAPHLHRLGPLTVVDTMPLACYCESYSRWRTAEEALARVTDRDEHMRGLVIKSADGNARRNPLVKIASDASAGMLRGIRIRLEPGCAKPHRGWRRLPAAGQVRWTS